MTDPKKHLIDSECYDCKSWRYCGDPDMFDCDEFYEEEESK